MFQLNDNVVYPGHGIARISRIIEKVIAGQVNTFYELKFLNQEMMILVPTNNAEAIGLRSLSSTEKINDIFKFLAEPAKRIQHHELASSNWNKRNKDYQFKLRTGNLRDISEIYRDLKHIAQHKELSFGEKHLMLRTEALLAEEIAIVRKVEEEKAIEHLRSIFNDGLFGIKSCQSSQAR